MRGAGGKGNRGTRGAGSKRVAGEDHGGGRFGSRLGAHKWSESEGPVWVPPRGAKIPTKSVLTGLCVNTLLVGISAPPGGPKTGSAFRGQFEVHHTVLTSFRFDMLSVILHNRGSSQEGLRVWRSEVANSVRYDEMLAFFI